MDSAADHSWVEAARAKLAQTSSARECLEQAFSIVTSRYKGDRLHTVTNIYELVYPLRRLWRLNGHLLCTNLNRVLRDLLIQTQWYEVSDVRYRWTAIWLFSPHQYVQVYIDDDWVDVDVWGYAYGVPLGEYSSGFRNSVRKVR